MEALLLKELEGGGLSAAADMLAAVVCSVDFLDNVVVVPGVVAVATIGGGATVGPILVSSLHLWQARIYDSGLACLVLLCGSAFASLLMAILLMSGLGLLLSQGGAPLSLNLVFFTARLPS